VRTERITPKPGQALQTLVAVIEKAAADNPFLEVKSPQHLVDKDTGRKREHDVVVTYKKDHHCLITAIECRDRSRKIGVPEVEAFQKKCERTGVHRGIIVSSKGFCKTAIEKANQLSVGCMSLSSVQGFDWCTLTHLTHCTRKMNHIRVVPIIGAAPSDADTLVAPDGSILSHDQIKQAALSLFDQNIKTDGLPPGPHKAAVRNEKPGVSARLRGGDTSNVDEIFFGYEYEIIENLVPARFHSYTDPATGQTSAEAVSFEMPLGELQGTLAIIRDASSAMKLMISARKP
jgi:hypothetical protein